MPNLALDTEQAALIKIAVEMLQAALQARLARADPEKVISDSLALQANKLESVMGQLMADEPPDWPSLAEGLRRRSLDLMLQLTSAPNDKNNTARWRELRVIATASSFVPVAPARHVGLPTLQG